MSAPQVPQFTPGGSPVIAQVNQRVLEGRLQSLEGITVLPWQPASAGTTINSTTVTTVTGTTGTFTPRGNGTVVVWSAWDIRLNSSTSTGDLFIGYLSVNGTTQAQQIIMSQFTVPTLERVHASHHWVLTVAAGTLYTILLSAQTQSANTTWTVNATHTGWSGLYIPTPYTPAA